MEKAKPPSDTTLPQHYPIHIEPNPTKRTSKNVGRISEAPSDINTATINTTRQKTTHNQNSNQFTTEQPLGKRWKAAPPFPTYTVFLIYSDLRLYTVP